MYRIMHRVCSIGRPLASSSLSKLHIKSRNIFVTVVVPSGPSECNVYKTSRNLSTNNPTDVEKKKEPEVTLTIQGDETSNKTESKETTNIDDYNVEVKVEMPDLGETKGKILRWYKKEGDVIRRDETICDIQTDMFTFGMDIEDENEGILKEILIKEGEDYVKPGTAICTIMHKPM